MSKIGISALVLSYLCLPIAAQAQDFGNDGVIALVEAGLGDDVILSKIDGLPCVYDVSTTSLIQLRIAGVSNAVISAMVQRCVGASRAQGLSASSSDPSVARIPGIYLDQGAVGSPDLVSLLPIMASSGQTTGNGTVLFPHRAWLGISGLSSAQAVSGGQPTLYFYFENDDRRVGSFGASGTEAAQSPNEFSLVKFRIRNGQRQVTVGESNMFSTRVGLDPEDILGVSIEQIGDGIFRVTPAGALEAGEYGFALKTSSDSYRIFDFSIR